VRASIQRYGCFLWGGSSRGIAGMSTPRRRRVERASQYESDAYRDLVARFAANLRRAREGRGWTQEQAAEHCEMVMQQFQRTEAGEMNVTFTTLARICVGFGIDVREFFLPAAPLAKRKRGRPPKAAPRDTAERRPDDSVTQQPIALPGEENLAQPTEAPTKLTL